MAFEIPFLLHIYISKEESIKRQNHRRKKHLREDLISPDNRYAIYKNYSDSVSNYFSNKGVSIHKLDTSVYETKEEGFEHAKIFFKNNNLI
jgi:hypothetical protein